MGNSSERSEMEQDYFSGASTNFALILKQNWAHWYLRVQKQLQRRSGSMTRK